MPKALIRSFVLANSPFSTSLYTRSICSTSLTSLMTPERHDKTMFGYVAISKIMPPFFSLTTETLVRSFCPIGCLIGIVRVVDPSLATLNENPLSQPNHAHSR